MIFDSKAEMCLLAAVVAIAALSGFHLLRTPIGTTRPACAAGCRAVVKNHRPAIPYRARPAGGPHIEDEIGVCVPVQAERASSATCPPLDDVLEFREAICQSGGTWLQDQGRFYLTQVLVPHSWN